MFDLSVCVCTRCLNLENREPENNVLVRSRCSGIQVEKGKKGAIPLFIFAYSAIYTYLGAMESSQMYKYHLIVNVDRARAKHRPITIDVYLFNSSRRIIAIYGAAK